MDASLTDIIVRYARKSFVTHTGCVEYRNQPGKRYPTALFNGKNRKLHRLAYEHAHGSIPGHLVVRHKCDNPKCFNPKHLELGTVADNNYDMVVRGRQSRGELHGKSVLDDNTVAEVVKEYTSGGVTLREVANKYNISRSAVYQWVNGRCRTNTGVNDGPST